jgi:hypothetical protein
MNDPSETVRVLAADGSRVISALDLAGVLAQVAGPSNPVTWVHAGLLPVVIQSLDDMGLGEIAVKTCAMGPSGLGSRSLPTTCTYRCFLRTTWPRSEKF